MASDAGMNAVDPVMNKETRSTKFFLVCAVFALILGIFIRTTGLQKANRIASDSKVVESQMEKLRNQLGDMKQAGEDLDGATWARIQSDLRSLNPEIFSHHQLIWQKFDPAARVRLLPGLDQQPGTIDVDDNVNGVIDDASELGATFSDALCIVEAAVSAPSNIKPSLVLQRGGYIDAKQVMTNQTRYADRILIQHQSRDDSWSLVLDW